MDGISIQRTNANGDVLSLMTVPVVYSPKEKMLMSLLSNPGINRAYSELLPRISFNLEGLTYDSNRKLPATNYVAAKQTNNATQALYQYTPVGYDFQFIATIYAKNVEDGCKIYEQIAPFFTPEYTLKVNLVPEIGEIRNIPITLKGIKPVYMYDEKFEDRPIYSWDLEFNVKGYLYTPVRSAPLINLTNTSFYIYDPVANSNALSLPTDSSVTIIDTPGLLANGSPTSNSAQTVPANTIFLDSDYGFIKVETIFAGQ